MYLSRLDNLQSNRSSSPDRTTPLRNESLLAEKPERSAESSQLDTKSKTKKYARTLYNVIYIYNTYFLQTENNGISYITLPPQNGSFGIPIWIPDLVVQREVAVVPVEFAFTALSFAFGGPQIFCEIYYSCTIDQSDIIHYIISYLIFIEHIYIYMYEYILTIVNYSLQMPIAYIIQISFNQRILEWSYCCRRAISHQLGNPKPPSITSMRM